VDEIVELIKSAQTPAEAKVKLMSKVWRSKLVEEMLARASGDQATAFRPESLPKEFGLHNDGYRLSETQAQRILEMQLQRLTGLEQDKIVSEYKEVMDRIADLLDILSKPERVTDIIAAELKEIKSQFGDKRRSEIIANGLEMSIEDLIANEEVVVTMSHAGYIKYQAVADYRAQKRGGRGKQATAMKEDDFIETLFIANTHDYVLCFSNKGRVYWVKVYEIPQGSRVSRGKPIVNLLQMQPDEKISAVLPVSKFVEDKFVFFATSEGVVKKTALSDFANPRKAGIIAIALDDGDNLIGVALTDGKHDVMLFSDEGKAVRFEESDVRSMGRDTRGVRGMNLAKGGKVISMLVAENEEDSVLTATERGYGKRTAITEYTRHGRGTQGMIAIQTSLRNGKVVGAVLVRPTDEIMMITTAGVLIRTKVKQIREMGRSTQGVTLINLDEGSKLTGLQKIVESDEEDDVEA
jgi:DNA gyrase subunit A